MVFDRIDVAVGIVADVVMVEEVVAVVIVVEGVVVLIAVVD